VSISANPASISPNLDILLQLQNSAGTVLVNSNPDTALNASVSYTVAAGTYYIKVQGTGRGDVLGAGYSRYGSIGSYSLSGTVPLASRHHHATAESIGYCWRHCYFLCGRLRFSAILLPVATQSRAHFRRDKCDLHDFQRSDESSGQLHVVVNNAYGYAESATAALTVNVPPTITTPTAESNGYCWQHCCFLCGRLRFSAIVLPVATQSRARFRRDKCHLHDFRCSDESSGQLHRGCEQRIRLRL